MTRTVTTTEAEWDGESYALVAGLADYEDSLCPRCGMPLAESMDPLSDPMHPQGTHRYVARVIGRCWSCDVLQRMTAKYSKDEDSHSESLHFGVDRQPRPNRTNRREPQ